MLTCQKARSSLCWPTAELIEDVAEVPVQSRNVHYGMFVLQQDTHKVTIDINCHLERTIGGCALNVQPQPHSAAHISTI
jgi:hypothetical protein